MSDNENKYDISKHPLVVIVLAVVGTFGFSYQFVLPIMTAKLQNDVDKIPVFEMQIKEDKVKIQELEQKLKQTESQLFIAQNANLFTQDSPYPVGLGKVRIGDPIANLITVYGEKELQKKDSFWSIDKIHSKFIHVTYYFNDESQKKEITHILFRTNVDSHNKDALQEILENNFGVPLRLKNDEVAWKTSNGMIYKIEDFSYFLYPPEQK
ncbi:MAG: hypothetical protein Q8O20_00775 [Sulfuricurvum sp.]|uniref:hypothetical protein n=1 Tax=Sulfuricurvum sp. TaxID=2025608 RepID=UPI00273621CF|nr:hypothetical protein [Sulfuricurvum sp.]MDP2849586.1 hypothetical protein [Sulfuricurvum sp.]